MIMFILDTETLGMDSSSVILSIALLHFDETKDNTLESLCENTLFLKLLAKEQINEYNRIVDKSTIEWWNKQCDLAKDFSFKPKKSDITVKEAITCLRNYISKYSKDPDKEICWIRGTLDQMVLDSLFNVVNEKKLFYYSNYRDVRTFLAFNTETGMKGYAEIDPELYPGTWNKEDVIKHNPVYDVAYDALQILYGK